MNGSRLLFALLMVAGGLVGCANKSKIDLPVNARGFQVEDIAKSDVDMVAEVQLRYSMEILELLMTKLYQRNPKQWQRGGSESLNGAVNRLFGPMINPTLLLVDGKMAVEQIEQAFTEEFAGDRVFSLVSGLRGMIVAAHNGKEVFYLTDQLDPQKLYHAARNIEIAVWRLSSNRDSSGRLYLVSNETHGLVDNLSYERLFGKLIALQDSMARIVAENSNRRIKSIIQSVASAVFLPI